LREPKWRCCSNVRRFRHKLIVEGYFRDTFSSFGDDLAPALLLSTRSESSIEGVPTHSAATHAPFKFCIPTEFMHKVVPFCCFPLYGAKLILPASTVCGEHGPLSCQQSSFLAIRMSVRSVFVDSQRG